MEPITLEAFDSSNKQLFSYTVDFSWEINVEQLLQRAFAETQSILQPDPFVFTLEYYGYSQSEEYPGYLGYELESLLGLESGPQWYWDLSVNGQSSPSGIDTTFPNPGSRVTLKYTFVSKVGFAAGSRLKAIQERRIARKTVSQKRSG